MATKGKYDWQECYHHTWDCTEFEVDDVIPGMDETRERRLSEKTLGEIPQNLKSMTAA